MKSSLVHVLKKYCLCSRVHRSAQLQFFKQLFLGNLHPACKIEMAKLSITPKDAVFPMIQTVKKTIYQNLSILNKIPNYKSESKPFTSNHSTHRTKLKYCSKHGYCIHETSQCLALKNKLPPNQTKRTSDHLADK